MSNALAIAGVTAILRYILNEAMTPADRLTTALGSAITVTALPPARVVMPDGAEKNQLNLFLYQVTPNQGWRNAGLPSRDSSGARLTNPPLALDLHYLVTAYGSKELNAEIILGYAMLQLHETPVLTRSVIRNMFINPPGGTPLHSIFEELSAENLADQVEQIKIIPETLNIEEISKLWAASQTYYRSTVAYQVSVLLIQSEKPARSPLPVLTRGPLDPATGRDEGVRVQPGLIPPYPSLQEALAQNNQVAIRMGDVLRLLGHHLSGAKLVMFKHLRSQEVVKVPVLQDPIPTSKEVSVELSFTNVTAPSAWQAGLYSVAAVIELPGQPERMTNEIPVALAPKITVSQVAGSHDVTLACSPKIRRNQQINLWVGEREIVPEPLDFDPSDGLADRIEFTITSQEQSGQKLLVRLRVDGVESVYIDRSGPNPVFDSTQQVEVP